MLWWDTDHTSAAPAPGLAFHPPVSAGWLLLGWSATVGEGRGCSCFSLYRCTCTSNYLTMATAFHSARLLRQSSAVRHDFFVLCRRRQTFICSLLVSDTAVHTHTTRCLRVTWYGSLTTGRRRSSVHPSTAMPRPSRGLWPIVMSTRIESNRNRSKIGITIS